MRFSLIRASLNRYSMWPFTLRISSDAHCSSALYSCGSRRRGKVFFAVFGDDMGSYRFRGKAGGSFPRNNIFVAIGEDESLRLRHGPADIPGGDPRKRADSFSQRGGGKRERSRAPDSNGEKRSRVGSDRRSDRLGPWIRVEHSKDSFVGAGSFSHFSAPNFIIFCSFLMILL